MKGLQDGVK